MTGAVTGSGVSRLGGLAKTSLREQALDVLRNAVTSGEIAPGTHLVETELSAALSISRGTLREALRQLEQEGLVEPSERGRLRVRTLSAAEIERHVRGSLRPGRAGRRPAVQDEEPQNRCPPTADRARRTGAATGSINEMVEIDLDFHRTLCTLTGNTALLRSWEGIAGSIRMSIMFAGTDRALGNMSVPRHQVLVDAVAAGDPDQARIAVEEHMREAANNLMTESDTDQPGHRLTLAVRQVRAPSAGAPPETGGRKVCAAPARSPPTIVGDRRVDRRVAADCPTRRFRGAWLACSEKSSVDC